MNNGEHGAPMLILNPNFESLLSNRPLAPKCVTNTSHNETQIIKTKCSSTNCNSQSQQSTKFLLLSFTQIKGRLNFFTQIKQGYILPLKFPIMPLMKLLPKFVLTFGFAHWSASYQMKLLVAFLLKFEEEYDEILEIPNPNSQFPIPNSQFPIPTKGYHPKPLNLTHTNPNSQSEHKTQKHKNQTEKNT